jgi:predicted nucleotidyltransferase
MITTIDKLISQIAHISRPEKIILFGSVVNEKHNVFSDIDLLIITDLAGKKEALRNEITHFAEEFSLRADILIHSPGEIEKITLDPNAFLSSVIRDGKIVYENA